MTRGSDAVCIAPVTSPGVPERSRSRVSRLRLNSASPARQLPCSTATPVALLAAGPGSSFVLGCRPTGWPRSPVRARVVHAGRVAGATRFRMNDDFLLVLERSGLGACATPAILYPDPAFDGLPDRTRRGLHALTCFLELSRSPRIPEAEPLHYVAFWIAGAGQVEPANEARDWVQHDWPAIQGARWQAHSVAEFAITNPHAFDVLTRWIGVTEKRLFYDVDGDMRRFSRAAGAFAEGERWPKDKQPPMDPFAAIEVHDRLDPTHEIYRVDDQGRFVADADAIRCALESKFPRMRHEEDAVPDADQGHASVDDVQPETKDPFAGLVDALDAHRAATSGAAAAIREYREMLDAGVLSLRELEHMTGIDRRKLQAAYRA